MEKALRRLDGVANVKVDLESSIATVEAKKGESFDPLRFPKALKDAGFAAEEIEITASGTLAIHEQQWRLECDDLPIAVILTEGKGWRDLEKNADLSGKTIRVTGKLDTSDTNEPLRLSVDRWTLESEEAGDTKRSD